MCLVGMASKALIWRHLCRSYTRSRSGCCQTCLRICVLTQHLCADGMLTWQRSCANRALDMQELHQIAQGLLSNLLRNLCSHQGDDAFAARAPTIDPAEPGGVAIEAWLPERYGSLDPAVHPPAWREPSTEQVCPASSSVAHTSLQFV